MPCRDKKQIIMVLLHHLTWQQFGIAALVLLIAWYGLLWLVFYRKAPEEPLPHRFTGFNIKDDEFEVLGAAEEPEGSSLVPLDGFSFAGRGKQEDAERVSGNEELQGLVPDALEEIKQVWHTVESKGGDKADFISLFKLVSAKYERLKTSRHIAAVNDWIADTVPFELTEDELWSLWD